MSLEYVNLVRSFRDGHERSMVSPGAKKSGTIPQLRETRLHPLLIILPLIQQKRVLYYYNSTEIN